MDVFIQDYNIVNSKMKFLIYDTSGCEKYKSIAPSYYRNSAGIFLVFDVTNKKSFENVEWWLNEIKKYNDSSTTILLIGNKCDILHREVDVNDAFNFAQAHGLMYMESSAKDNINVRKIFHMMATCIHAKLNSKLKINDECGIFLEKRKEENCFDITCKI